MANEAEQIRQAITALEAQRALLGDAVVDTTLAPLREKLAQLETAPAAEQRKLVTVLFADLVGFTAMSEKMDPEEVRDITNAYFNRWTTVIEKYGGAIEKFIGDAVMSVFGLAAAKEDDPESAIRAALEMKTVLSELNAELAAQNKSAERKPAAAAPSLRMRVGIHTGPVVVGLLDERKNQDFVVVGDTVNLASRLQSNAPADGILITQDTYRHVKGVFDVQVVEPLTLKGKTEPVKAYLVVGAKPRAFRVNLTGVEGSLARMVGREGEMRRLKDAYVQVQQNHERRVVTVVGEAGMGKSRMIYELDDWIETQPGDYYYFLGRANQAMQKVSFSLVRDVFAFRFLIQDSDLPGQVKDKLERGFQEGLGEDGFAAMKAAFIGRMMGFEMGDNPFTRGVDARQILDRGLAYLEEYFRGMTSQGLVVALLEDIHWADDSTLELLARLDASLSDRPILMVCTARPSLYERQPQWEEGPATHLRLDLQPLTRDESSSLVAEILDKVQDLPEELRALVVNSADGNPFYIEELIKMLIEEGVVVKGEEKWQVAPERLAQTQIPSTLTEVIQSRFDSLSMQERVILQKAAVIGRTFWDEAVDYLGRQAGADPRIGETGCLDYLDGLNRREMVYLQDKSTFEGTKEFHFKHALFRDVTYESLLKRYRKIYHAHAARWLQEVTGRSGRAEEYASLIADHYDEAGEAQEAAGWYARAAKNAASRYANAEAVRLYGRALELTPTEEEQAQFEYLIERERIYHLLGTRPNQVKDLEALDQLLERPQEQEGDLQRRTLVEVEWALYFDNTGNYPAAIQHSEKIITYSQKAGLVDLEAKGHLLWASASWHHSNYSSGREHALLALGLAERAGLKDLQAQSLLTLGVVSEVQGDYQTGLGYLKQALTLYRVIGDQVGESRVLNSMGVTSFNMNDLVNSHAYYLQSLNIKRLIGHRYGLGVSLCNLGIVARRQFELSTALDYFEEGLQVCEEIDDLEGKSTALAGLGSLTMALGNYPLAEKYYVESLEIARQIGDQEGEISNLTGLAEVSYQSDHLNAAREQFSLALKISQQIGTPNYEGFIQLALGDVYLNLGFMDEASQSFQRSVQIRQELGQAGLLLASRGGLARLAFKIGNLPEARAMAVDLLEAVQSNAEVANDELILIYLTCYQILLACDDPAAGPALQNALALLDSSAAKIRDDQMRASFLSNVRVNRQLAAYRDALQQDRSHG